MSGTIEGGEEIAAMAVQKRYEGLLMVRNKAIRGKGAWYWNHLEPLLVHNSDNGLAKSVKLKCCLCHTLFSASNPSRTASEHLKKGTCPHFSSSIPNVVGNSTPIVVEPLQNHSIKSPPPLTPTPITANATNRRKRSSSSSSADGGGGGGGNVGPASYASPISVIEPSARYSEMGGASGGSRSGNLVVHHHHQLQQPPHLLALPSSSSIKDELMDARGLFEDSIKRLKSPKASPSPALTKSQIDCALDFLSEWVYESCGSVSFSSLEHPKFKAFLHQVGMPEICKRDFCGSRLDSRFEDVRNECEARIRGAQFFQLASDGWKCKLFEENLVHLTVNLPNGSSVYKRAMFTGGRVPSKYAEEVLWETIVDICGNTLHKCVGIVTDKFSNSALRNLESQNQWMVNLSCQYKAFRSLIKHFFRELPLFKNVAESCLKVANFVNNTTLVRNCFHKYQLREYGHAGLIRIPTKEHDVLNFDPVYVMIEDIMSSARVLQLVMLDESYKIVSMDDLVAREFGEVIRDVGFWNDIEAVRSLVKLVNAMAHEFELERPRVGQCLPLWEELRMKVKDWCVKFHIEERLVLEVIERQFRKKYHPAWAAAYILDPLYLIKDSSGKYLPPFKCLTPNQEKDVDKLITRLVSREEAHIALMELMKWRTEGLDPVYAQAVQLKQRDPCSGKMKIANPHGSRLVWETYLPEFKSLRKVAIRLIFLNATARGFKCNPNVLKWVQYNSRSRFVMDKVQKMLYISAQSRLERRDFSSDGEKEADVLAYANGEDDGVLNEAFVDQ